MSCRNPDLDRLIILYLSRRASKCERQELEEWLHTCAANRKVFDRLKDIWHMSHDEYHPDMDQVRDRIWAAGTKTKAKASKPVNTFYWSKVAATILLFLTVGWLTSYLINDKTSLIPEKIALVEKINPPGQKSTHMLPDGTKVWLNAESSLNYLEKFTDTIRLVQLRGEAYFEVAHDSQRSFIVETGNIRTQVIGTSFNINAVQEDAFIKISLLEGKVKVQDADRVQTANLSPGEELLAPKDSTKFSKQRFSYENTFGWKEGILVFDGTDFIAFRNTIQKWYGVKVEIRGDPPLNWNIRARYQNEDLEHVLTDICFNKNINFEIKDKNVIITF